MAELKIEDLPADFSELAEGELLEVLGGRMMEPASGIVCTSGASHYCFTR
ncbi:hypothetical protein ACSDR0_41160 [Streptosporangium sp. G11]